MVRVIRDPETRNEWDLFGRDGVSRIGRVQRAGRGEVYVWMLGESSPMQRRFVTVAEVAAYFRREPELITGQGTEADLPGTATPVTVDHQRARKAAPAAPTVCGTCFQVPAANGVCGCD